MNKYISHGVLLGRETEHFPPLEKCELIVFNKYNHTSLLPRQVHFSFNYYFVLPKLLCGYWILMFIHLYTYIVQCKIRTEFFISHRMTKNNKIVYKE